MVPSVDRWPIHYGFCNTTKAVWYCVHVYEALIFVVDLHVAIHALCVF